MEEENKPYFEVTNFHKTNQPTSWTMENWLFDIKHFPVSFYLTLPSCTRNRKRVHQHMDLHDQSLDLGGKR